MKEIEKIINRKEIINGFQPETTNYQELEERNYFRGFEDGRSMMKADLFNFINKQNKKTK